jgi:HAD superfamily hydrolase (TIGR01509 family)
MRNLSESGLASTGFLIVFDCDGVLVDSERLTQDVDMRMISELGWPITRDEIFEQHLGRSELAIVANIEQKLGRPLPADFIDERRVACAEEYRQRLTQIEGVSHAIELLQAAGFATCVASSGTHVRIRLMLELTGLRQPFGDRIFSAEDVKRGKPSPDLFLHAAETMGYLPESCIVVEDSPSGVAAALAAKMPVVGYCALTPAQALKDASALVSDMRHLTSAIRGLTS